jgi:4-hydroxybenzoyl-CoA reductase subunit alpha
MSKNSDLNVVGKPLMKIDALGKVRGETIFADDIFLPRMAYCKILRSPHPHALIKYVDATPALERPGVYAVITGKDLPIKYGILPVSQDEEAHGGRSGCCGCGRRRGNGRSGP